MSESNKNKNSLSHDEQEMKKYDKNSNRCVALGLGFTAVGLLLFFLVTPIAGIAVASAGLVPACVAVYQAFKYRKYRKKVEVAKKKETNAKANSVSKDISKEKEKEKSKNINLNFSQDKNANISQNNQNNSQGLNVANISNTGGNNFSSGVDRTGQQLQNSIQIPN